MNLIETDHLSRRYWRTEAVHDLSFSVPEGSVCALLGANGAGKTTTLKLLMNLLTPSAGTARVLGVDARHLSEREFRQIGYVSENQSQPLWMTVRQLLDFCRPFYPTWDRELEAKLQRDFDLPLDRKLSQLSRGMLMKAVLLSSLAYRPKLLVLDEPFSGLDPLARHEFIGGLIEAARLGEWTVLVSSHDIDDVERLVDRTVVIDAGRLVLEESTEALLRRFRRIELEVGEFPTSALSAELLLPASWWEYEQEGARAKFIESAYEPAVTEAACLVRFPSARVTAHAMTLREIFICLARQGRRAAKGVAA
ncbi:MAG: ABC transporter ATP-binding protein [Opitutus sp.]|nr:ABC transporter ATP-binding protein [Opitutus sp.]